ncbi:biotin holocarboxylase synthetase [Entomophthora muscae]|uniref:Biotin holocarboxylase synthetase n=1 Tax=Entomophthora muscae TaxID=34485 RepID=A0ACC2UB49_9FUNG|nr:biotin holocarboxylase synthetase [Entomophthora muscae]
MYWLALGLLVPGGLGNCLDVLVYTGPGTEFNGDTLHMLKDHLSGYRVRETNASELGRDAWVQSTALVVIPGGRDLPYVEHLTGKPNQNIVSFVRKGGKYLGLGAGAYYASDRIDFEAGTRYEVKGDRPLSFFPGSCRGAAFPGFEYSGDNGAKAAIIKHLNHTGPMYYKGGGIFVNASSYAGVDVLASFDEVQGTNAAVVLCEVQHGKALLASVHPTYRPTLSSPKFYETLGKEADAIKVIVNSWFQKLGLLPSISLCTNE